MESPALRVTGRTGILPAREPGECPDGNRSAGLSFQVVPRYAAIHRCGSLLPSLEPRGRAGVNQRAARRRGGDQSTDKRWGPRDASLEARFLLACGAANQLRSSCATAINPRTAAITTDETQASQAPTLSRASCVHTYPNAQRTSAPSAANNPQTAPKERRLSPVAEAANSSFFREVPELVAGGASAPRMSTWRPEGALTFSGGGEEDLPPPMRRSNPRPSGWFATATAYSSENRYSRSLCVRLRAKPSSPSTSEIVCALRCCNSQIFSSTVPGAIRR